MFSSDHRLIWMQELPQWMWEYCDDEDNRRKGRRLVLYRDDVIIGAPHFFTVTWDASVDNTLAASKKRFFKALL